MSRSLPASLRRSSRALSASCRARGVSRPAVRKALAKASELAPPEKLGVDGVVVAGAIGDRLRQFDPLLPFLRLVLPNAKHARDDRSARRLCRRRVARVQ